MHTPLPRPVLLPTALPWARSHDPGLDGALCCGDGGPPQAEGIQLGARARLADLDPHLHCSVIGTCLSTGELRKLMARFIAVRDMSDLDVHHEAVRLVSHPPEVAKAIHKALDRRHDATVQRYARAKDEAALAGLWDDSLRSGEVPGAYWALLTHRRTTPGLRQRVFGDVHMLSHLVGAANRADIRRLVALERENDELRDRLDRAQERNLELVAARDTAQADRDAALQDVGRLQAGSTPRQDAPADDAAAALLLGLQTQRREAAEAIAESGREELRRLVLELDKLHTHAAEMARELAAAEAQLQAEGGCAGEAGSGLETALHGKRVLYVGGRPSSTPAIRAIASRAGAEFRKHDGGVEDRKGLLGAALAWSDIVVFPVDCVDHDSALALKRDCLRQRRPFFALRTASAASFLAAMSELSAHGRDPFAVNGLCVRHG